MNIEQLRKDTPGTAKVIHLNNAGAALVPQVVLDCQIDYLKQEAMMGPYEAANAAREDFEKIYMSIARMLGAKPDEIALQENATVAWNNAFAALTFQPGDKILTGENEYASNYMNFLLAQKRYGVEIVVVPSDLSGQIDVEEMAKLIDKKVKLIAITHIPTNGGLIQPAAAVGKLAKAAGITYLLDACQSAGQMVLDVEAIGCDLLSATGRKWLRGPRGTGFLYVRQGLLEKLEPATLDLHSANWVAKDRYVMQPNAKRFENWEFNYAACLGLGKAVDYALALGFASIETRVQWLARRLRHILAEEMRLPVYDLGEEKGGIVTFSVPDRSADQVKADLAAKGINVSTSTASGTRLDAERRGLPDLVRASPHYYNTEEDLSSLARTIGKTRKISA